jgi:hypothetical protein
MERKQMLTFLPNLPDDVEDTALCECHDCGHQMEAWECDAITNFHKRIAVGDNVPAGECGKCGGLAYLMDDVKASQNDE